MLGRDGGRDEGIVAGASWQDRGGWWNPPPAHSTLAEGTLCYACSPMPLALEVCVNDRACWRNVPLPFWRYELVGYRMLKKRLSCWGWGVLGRTLLVEEVTSLVEMGRGVAGTGK